jgi:hypothetical protein
MSDVSEQLTALIKELLVLDREESTPALEPQTLREVEGRKSKRKRLRQELVQFLSLHNRRKF